MKNRNERMAILENLEAGLLSPEDAANQLQEDHEQDPKDLEKPMEILAALEAGKLSADQAAEKLGGKAETDTRSTNHVSKIDKVKTKQGSNAGSLWIAGLITGLITLVISARWMLSRLSNANGVDFWFFVAWIPFFIGLLIIMISWISKNSPWIKIRIHSKNNGNSRRFNFGFPIPKSLIIWGLQSTDKIIGKGMNSIELDGIFELLEQGNLEEPIIIHIDDDDNNIEIEIG